MQDLIQTDRLQANSSTLLSGIGTLGSGVSAKHFSADGRHFVTELTFSGITVGTVAAAAKGIGVAVFTLPSGVALVENSYMSVALDNADASCDADDPKVGLGSVVASGAVSVLNGTATFMDYITEQTATNCDGVTPTVAFKNATAGANAGISLNVSGSSKVFYLNAAVAWSGTTTITATGTITINWVKIA